MSSALHKLIVDHQSCSDVNLCASQLRPFCINTRIAVRLEWITSVEPLPRFIAQ
jgi:hypothetical protein